MIDIRQLKREMALRESRVRYLETERAAIVVEAERRIAKIDAEIARVDLHRPALLSAQLEAAHSEAK